MTLKELREEAGKTRKEVAEALGVAYSTYANYEQSKRRLSFEQVITLMKIFNCSAEKIITAQLNSCH